MMPRNLITSNRNPLAFDRFRIRSYKYSITCDGTTLGILSFGASAGYAIQNAGGISLWLKPGNKTPFNEPIAIETDANNRVTIYFSANVLTVATVAGGASPLNNAVAAANEFTNKWFHLVMTWDITDTRVYINGALRSTFAGDKRPSLTGTPTLKMGSTIFSLPFLGNIGPLSLHNAKLTQTDVNNLYSYGTPASNEVAAWDFLEGSGSVLLTRGAGNNGTLGAGNAWSSNAPSLVRNPLAIPRNPVV